MIIVINNNNNSNNVGPMVCRILGRAPFPVRLTYNVTGVWFAFTFQCIFIKRSENRTSAGWKRCRTRLTNAYEHAISVDTYNITLIYMYTYIGRCERGQGNVLG